MPRAMARFNRRVVNPFQRRYAGVIPAHGIVEHTGRKSGRAYQTPVLVFRSPTGFSMIVGYGLHSDWVRNLEAAGGGGLQHRRRHYAISRPRIVHGEDAYQALPRVMRSLARLVHVEGVLQVDATEDRPAAAE